MKQIIPFVFWILTWCLWEVNTVNASEANLFMANISNEEYKSNVFVDINVNKYSLNEGVLDHNTFHLFSHGRSGQLSINGHWLDAEQIAKFLKQRITNYSHLNVYGCEFGKGEKGENAVRYLEDALGLSVSASADITGKDGDWKLEIGEPVAVMGMESYAFNLQCISPSATNPDSDGDGVPDVIDADIDNDGISNLLECGPETGSWVSSSGASAAWTGGTSSTVSISGNGTATGSITAGLTTYNTTSAATATNSVGIPSSTFTARTRAGTNSGSGTITYTFSPAVPAREILIYLVDVDRRNAAGTPVTGTFSVVAAAGSSASRASFYQYYTNGSTANGFFNRSTGALTFPTVTSNAPSADATASIIFKGVSNDLVSTVTVSFTGAGTSGAGIADAISVWLASTQPCAVDTDGDNIPNKLDLDSDNDGIPDAYESGCTSLSTTLTNCRLDLNPSILDDNGCPTGVTTVVCSAPADTDSDGVPDYLDTDSDGDGCSDAKEAGTKNFIVNDNTTNTYGAPAATPDGLTNAGCFVPVNNNFLVATVSYACIPPAANNNSSTGNTPGANVTQNILANDLLSDGTSPATPANTSVLLTTTGLPAGSSVSGNTLTVPGQGVWTYDPATGNLTFDPNPGFTSDPTACTYTLTETSTGLTDNATAAVGYNQVAPAANNDSSTNNTPGTNVTQNILTNDLLSDGSPATPANTSVLLTTTGLPAGSSVSGNTLTVPGQGVWTYDPATSDLTFDPNPGFTSDPTAITYTLTETGTGLTDNATAVVGYNPALPVRLVSFQAMSQENDVLLTWKAADQVSFDRYEIERSLNGKQFAYVGTEESNELKAGNYQFIDRNAAMLAGTRYYRLKMIDTDGTYAYSSMRSVRFENVPTIVAWPTVLAAGETINLSLPESQSSFKIKMHSLSGNEVFETNSKLKSIQLPTKGLATGLYLVNVTSSDGWNKTIKIAVVK
ncbi:DUF4347 domain-containing protein [Dyadobacter sp. LHD-138]|uniref:DUF4347 domain-containing protein n=1 Tax=Dyadobacter sp. LHD-138 TaxID=3071413 RepID=UPI0027E09D82|nr:DUF4347 domain-containing protein [Dyadobacter sp. LHD-138]MDQ6480569.1 DUF4347 domain-containing protein [Dyadobacter sp. LHD-138]